MCYATTAGPHSLNLNTEVEKSFSSIGWASATKGGHDPPATVFFRRYDDRISRIFEDEHEHEQPTLKSRATRMR
jgi:hypothetical protein